MSLLVNAYTRNAAGEIEFLDAGDQSRELAGVEEYRQTFYGGRAACSLGLHLFSTLAERDLYAEGQDLVALESEARLVLANIEMFTDQAGASSESLQVRIQNILDAIERAAAAGGGVVIW
jgi:hypothetical protein